VIRVSEINKAASHFQTSRLAISELSGLHLSERKQIGKVEAGQLLGTRCDIRTRCATVSAVTSNRVISERLNNATGADQDAIADVIVDLILAHLEAGCPDVTCITGANAVGAVHRDYAGPNSNGREVGTGRIDENAVRGVVREDRIMCKDSGPGSGVKAIAAAGQPHIVERDGDFIRCSAGNRVDSVKRIVTYDGVPHIQCQVIGFIYRDSVTSVEPENHTIFDVHCLSLKNVDSIDSITEPVYGNTSDGNHVSGSGVYNDPVHEGGEDRSKRAGAIERD